MEATTEDTSPQIQQLPPTNSAGSKIFFNWFFLPIQYNLLFNGIGLLLCLLFFTFVAFPQIPTEDHRFTNWSTLFGIIVSLSQILYGFILLKKKKRIGTIEFNDKKTGYFLLIAGSIAVGLGLALALFLTISPLYNPS